MITATSTVISIARDFSRTPGGRYRSDGPFSGEEFREDILQPAFQQTLANGRRLSIDLDGVAGYATSFLEEAFGGLVRSFKQRIHSHLNLVSENNIRLREVEEYISDEEAKL